MIEVTVKGLANLEKTIAGDKAAGKKDLVTAIKVTGFNLRRKMIKEIKAGAPGGVPFKPLSFIRRVSGGRLRPDRPYAMPHGVRGRSGPVMASLIRYNIERQNPFALAVGWSGPRISNSYKRRAILLQEGFETGISEKRRFYFTRIGAGLGKRQKARKFFFLKKTTTRFKTPARPVIDPFWKMHQDDAWLEIRDNFRRKRRGERI